jgi:tRNA pseudouridine38-40 synthase
MRIALALEYDGRPFCGWQTQPSGYGVQDAVTRAVSAIAGEPVSVVCAGRTDAGVHALAQVVHFDTRADRQVSAWTRGVNARLPGTIAVLGATSVPDDFHARFDAVERTYSYVLLERPERPGLLAGRVGWHYRPLSVDRMREAAASLEGTHDFSAFRSSQCQAKSPIRTLHELSIRRSGDCILVDLRANAFLHHMVRNMLGALVYVGDGRRPVQWLAALLASRDRTRGAPTFPAAGLYLTGVRYGHDWQPPSVRRTMAPLP